jgi:hypothetical protein
MMDDIGRRIPAQYGDSSTEAYAKPNDFNESVEKLIKHLS